MDKYSQTLSEELGDPAHCNNLDIVEGQHSNTYDPSGLMPKLFISCVLLHSNNTTAAG